MQSTADFKLYLESRGFTLREHWSKQNPVYSNSIMRRIMKLDGLIDVPMF